MNGCAAATNGGGQQAKATIDAKTREVTLANNLVRVRFHPAVPGPFKLFPKGYTGYTLEAKSPGGWAPMATARYFSAYAYRSSWGRDWLHYVSPEAVATRQEGAAATAEFSGSHADLDGGGWSFSFAFTLRPGRPVVDVVYTATTSARRELLLFWGPRLYAGEGTFGGAKHEALFPGLEYLGPNDHSSANPALAPDAQLCFAPHPVKITIPLMTVVHGGRMVGLMWDPLQKWNGADDCPTAVFASPNRLEGKDNHLLGLFVPGGPRYVCENGLRAHKPAAIEPGKAVTLRAALFAAEASHAIDAVALYLAERGGPPAPAAPMDRGAALNLLVQGATRDSWDAGKKGWRRLIGIEPNAPPSVIVNLREAASLLQDASLARRARQVADEALSAQPARSMELALRVGGLPRVLDALEKIAAERMRTQQPDGSWIYTHTDVAEGGLYSMHAPPENRVIAPAGAANQGITATRLADLWEHVLVTGDAASLAAALRGQAALDRCAIPLVMLNDECPPAPSLHGAYLGLRCSLAAYRVTGEKRHLDRAVYWARTGLPFVYLWSQGPRKVATGSIYDGPKVRFVTGESLYRDTRRDPMLYGALYGYGSSQFMHHWYGILVPWIGLVYAQDIAALAEHDASLPWRRIAEGIVDSCLAQASDLPPQAGYWPDAFNLETWVPSGPWLSPEALLESALPCLFARPTAARTIVLRDGPRRCHVTASATIGAATFSGNVARFTLSDPGAAALRAVAAPVREPTVTVDGAALARVDDLEKAEHGWTIFPKQSLVVKVRQNGRPRTIEIRQR